jgi:hypothetical protein
MTTEESPPRTESNTEVVIRLMKQGGYILVAGGGVSELPERFRSHPQIILWDDNKQNNGQKTVPSNTRAIVYNRWVSHALAGRLRNAAAQLKIPTFAMLKTREIKEFLSEIVHEPIVPTEVVEEIKLVDEAPAVETKGYLTADELADKEGEMRKPKRGEMGGILAEEDNDATETPASAVRRLHPIVKKKYGITMTMMALEQAIRYNRIKRGQPATPNPKSKPVDKGQPEATSAVEKPIKAVMTDDFSEAERMLRDARSALDLMIEFIPKLRKQLNEQKKTHEKLKALLLKDL